MLIWFHIIAAILSHFTVMDGWLSQYDQGPTDGTIVHNQEAGLIPQDLSAYAGVVATESCEHVGKPALLAAAGRWLPVMIFDCSGDQESTDWMLDNNIVAEVGYYLAIELDMLDRGGVRAKLMILTPD